MKSALKIVAGIAGVILLGVIGLAIYLYQSAIDPSRPVGFQQLAIADPGRPRNAAAIW
jgi:hypothetical protein